jgi:hypothetical protein
MKRAIDVKTGGARPRDSMMIAWWILLVLIIGTVVFIRVRLLAMPLERDEGEYAYAGQLMLRGIPPYQLAYNMKFPGTYAAYAVIMALFGQTPTGIHFGLLLLNLVTVALVFAMALRLTNTVGAIVAAAAFAVLSVSPSILGLAAHAEHFVLLPALGATLLLLDRRQNLRTPRLLASGALFGLAVLMKQPAIFFLAFGGCYLLYRDFCARTGWRSVFLHAVAFAGGAALPLALTFSALWAAGVFPKAWFWTVTYARAYGTIVPFGEGAVIAAHMTRKILGAIWPLGGLALLGLAGLVWNGSLRKHSAFFALLFLGSSAALCSGLYFREHYYVSVLPVLSLLAGIAVVTLLETFRRCRLIAQSVVIIVVAAALAYPLVKQSQLFFVLSPDDACTFVYRGNVFRDAVRIGAYLREQTGPKDTLAVLGSEPEIYFYAGRRSATGYIYTYALMEEHSHARAMQEEMEHEIEQARPKFLILVSLQTSWFVASWSDRTILQWASDYASRNYHAVGFINVPPDGEKSDYCLPCERTIDPSASVLIFERNL